MAEVILSRTAPSPIPAALQRGARYVLPDRSGYFVILDPDDYIACPVCRRSMAFAVVVQEAPGDDPASTTWSYRCLHCVGPESEAAARAREERIRVYELTVWGSRSAVA